VPTYDRDQRLEHVFWNNGVAVSSRVKCVSREWTSLSRGVSRYSVCMPR
jgi:hypothetical protein